MKSSLLPAAILVMCLLAAGQACARIGVLSSHAISKTERVLLLGEREKEDPKDTWTYLNSLQIRLERLVQGKWKTESTVRFHPDAQTDRAQAFVKDMDRDGRLEVALAFDSQMAVRTETSVYVFRIVNHRLHRVGSVVGMYGGHIGDLNKDGVWEIETVNQAGDESSYILRRWPTYRSIEGNQFKIVNSKLPDQYWNIKKQILDELVRRPYADDLWAYYGLCVRYTKSKEKPRDVYLRVAKLASEWLTNHPGGSSEVSDKTLRMCLSDLLSAAKKNTPFPTVSSLK